MASHAKVAIVTGGGPGVGRTMALGLSCAGFRVAIRVDQGTPERTGFRGLGQANGPFGRGAIRSGSCSGLEPSAAGGGRPLECHWSLPQQEDGSHDPV